MIVQDKIVSQINKATLSSWSHSVIFEGLEGSGKHELAEMLAKKLNLEMLDITDSIDSDTLDDISFRIKPYLYIIDGNKIPAADARKQNKLLKFIEEPMKNSFIVIYANTSYVLLDTIKNRCQYYKLEPYSKETLAQLLDTTDEVALDICKTPGDVEKLKSCDYKAMYDYAKLVVDRVAGSNFANSLTISDKINFKDEPEKYDFNLFVRMILHYILECYKTNSSNLLFEGFKLTKKLQYESYLPNLNKRYLFDSYIINLRRVFNGC